MQTRSMTRRAGVPHDLEAFNSYAEDIIGFVDKHNMQTRSKSKKVRVRMEFDNFNDATFLMDGLLLKIFHFIVKKSRQQQIGKNIFQQFVIILLMLTQLPVMT